MMQISLRQLEYFVAAARHGGAARAAEALHVSQPSISKAIADLESLWGEPLFVRRHAKGMDLTAAGMARMREAGALLQAAQQLSGPRTAAMAGVLRLGFLSTLGARWLPEILTQMQKRYPEIALELVEGDIDTLTRQVERGGEGEVAELAARRQFGDRVVGEERILGELKQRIRDVVVGPDGALYVATDSGDGKILKVTPKA